MAGKVLIFDNPDDFLKCMEELQREYNKQHEKDNNTLVGAGNYE